MKLAFLLRRVRTLRLHFIGARYLDFDHYTLSFSH